VALFAEKPYRKTHHQDSPMGSGDSLNRQAITDRSIEGHAHRTIVL
jgi:hypothetical protein